ncbi:hypothetical protein EML15_05930 [Corynebacterium sp. sy017]|uniref:hypothetical protein n=1 Tax=unclassified Corynebacterium TaxID=2624378 RepID=UPI0011853B75|nr:MULTISPECIES: hypothetical protein [unclassified Corynebacterium]MBP3088687.1 hypothetical protein [Corynebacterium sp. sy017]QDZ42088.1 hypothetical protein FQV43_02050 [Corynebacterium sp. sy039]TSD91975.1 hypothetical protein ELY17_05930 [Corynebacterium sp. SY003]
MRIKGIILLILGVVLFGLSLLMLGGHDVRALHGALLMGAGGASLVASLVYLLDEKPRMQ